MVHLLVARAVFLLCSLSSCQVNGARTRVADVEMHNATSRSSCAPVARPDGALGKAEGCQWVAKTVNMYCQAKTRIEVSEKVMSTEECGNMAFLNSECEDSPYQIYTNVEDNPKSGGKCRCVKKGEECDERASHGQGNVLYELVDKPEPIGRLVDCLTVCPRGSGFCESCGTGKACCKKGWRKNCAFGGCDVAQCDRVEESAWTELAPAHECVSVQPNVRVFKSEDAGSVLHMAPAEYPEPLKGIIWMDQVGYYGHSDIPESATAPDCLVAFGDMANPLKRDEDTPDKSGKQVVDIFGPSWSWFNNGKAYEAFEHLGGLGFRYMFEWSKDYTYAQIKPTVGVTLSDFILDFNMELQTPPEWCSTCAGLARPTFEEELKCNSKTWGADDEEWDKCKCVNKDEISRCAKWKRESVLPFHIGGKFYYYAFEIIDKDGNKVEPYFSKYMEFVSGKCMPDAGMAFKKSIHPSTEFSDIEEEDTQFIGLSE